MPSDKDPKELFTLITGKDISDLDNDPTGVEFLDKVGYSIFLLCNLDGFYNLFILYYQMENYEKNEEKLRSNESGPDCFDEMFEKSRKENSSNSHPREDK